MQTTPTLMPELAVALRDAARLRSAQPRWRRRRLRLGLPAVVLATGLTGAAIAGGLPGALTPEQRAAQDSAAQASRAILTELPRVDAGDLPPRLRALHELGARDPLPAQGWRIPGAPAAYLFAVRDGDYCLLAESGASCTRLQLLSPHVDLGYSAVTDRSTLTVLALGEVDTLAVALADGTERRIRLRIGMQQAEIPGRVQALRWSLRGEEFQVRTPGDVLAPVR